jgi:hypothetical protein
VIFLSGLAGFIFLLMSGVTIPKFLCIPEFKTNPIIKGVTFPPIAAMTMMGCIARNLFGASVAEYPESWPPYVGIVAVSLFLMRASINLKLKENIFIMIIFSMIPSMVEVLTIALLGWLFFEMPVLVCMTYGLAVTAISPAVILALLRLQAKNHDPNREVIPVLLACVDFDMAFVMTLFGIFSALAA